MCGIFGIIGNNQINQINIIPESLIVNNFKLGSKRGPESEKYTIINKEVSLGFHRLAINGLNEESNQPFYINGIYLVCNGEIYNYKNLYSRVNVVPVTQSDCEVIIHLYLQYGIEYTLELLDGVFSFILYDSIKNKTFISRDPYGVRPLYYCSNDSVVVFASELKQIHKLGNNCLHFPPGNFLMINSTINQLTFNKYSSFPFIQLKINSHYTIYDLYNGIYNKLLEAVKKRTIGTTDRPVACLLSGGLDSSLITAMVNSFLPKGTLETYSIGLPGSVDLTHAKIVADYLGTKHTEVILDEVTFISYIPEVIKTIESYDTTTVRASVGNYLIGKYIASHSNAKVIFNGDGSDELTGGYLYFHKVPDNTQFDFECRRLLRDIYMFDVLRSDKCISSNGLEPRTPFLDRSFVEFYLSIPVEIRCQMKMGEKYLLRKAINYCNSSLIPKEILYRRKEAFSDGVSSNDRSWYQVINEYLLKNNPNGAKSEKEYYREIFDKEYPNCGQVVDYYWMPKYSNTDDPSARTLDYY